MAELTNRDERSAKLAQAEHGKQSDDSQDFDVIYIGGIPPLRQVWADIKTVIRQRRELRNGTADGIEWEHERREAETMAELTNRDERSAKLAQAKETYRRTGELPPGKLDVIYIGGIPPLRQVWRDMKAIIKERRESPPPLE